MHLYLTLGEGVGEGDTIVESILESSTVMSGDGTDTCLPLGAFLGVLNSFSLSAAAVKEDLLVSLFSIHGVEAILHEKLFKKWSFCNRPP